MPLCDATGNSIISDGEKAQICSDAFVSNFCDVTSDSFVPFQNGLDVNITYDNVSCYLNNLKASNSCGPDGYPNVFLRGAAQGLLKPITIILQRSIFEATIPDAWRIAKVLSLYKGKGDKADPNAYRPISLTSCVG